MEYELLATSLLKYRSLDDSIREIVKHTITDELGLKLSDLEADVSRETENNASEFESLKSRIEALEDSMKTIARKMEEHERVFHNHRFEKIQHSTAFVDYKQ